MDEKINKPSEGEEIIDITTEIAKDIPLPQTQQALESHQNINSSEKKEENTNFNITSKEASSFIKIIVSKDNLQISDFDENQQKFLKEN
ncbi:hypothetical protein IJM86_01530 [bacterium]|nr:hypothetical protein [bacterium]